MKTDYEYVPQQMDDFIERLIKEGAQMKDLTNEWEVARWKWNDKTLIIYKTKRNWLSFSDTMAFHQFQAFENDVAWPHRLRKLPQ